MIRLVRRRPGDVGEQDADPGVRPHPTAQRRRADGIIQGGEERILLVAETRTERRFNERGTVVREVDLDPALTIGERNPHGGNETELEAAALPYFAQGEWPFVSVRIRRRYASAVM